MIMLPRENLPHRGQNGSLARQRSAFQALGLAAAALLMTACSPDVFHPASVQDGGSYTAPATASTQEQDHAGRSAAALPSAPSRAEDDESAPLPALAAEVKNARETQRAAVADGASSLAAAHERHQQELEAQEQRLAQEEAEAEIERQRLEDQAAAESAEESAGAQDEATAEPEDDGGPEADGGSEADGEQEENDAAEAPAEEDSPTEPVPAEPAPAEPAPEEPALEDTAPEAPGQSLPEASADAPVFAGDLSDYLDELAAHYPGDISISLAELGGEGRSGSTAGGESRVSASTYKVYVAYGILSRVESGAMDWDDPIDGGRDRAACLADMISVSDNPCADVFREELGWEALREIAAEAGGPATDFIPAYARTSANDLTGFMTRLESGALDLTEESRSRLLGALESNIFRDGIGAGSLGTVLNKVGFIDGHLNDTAIVRHPQGTYVLSVMSEGSDWDTIASITRDVEAALY